jgi:glutamine amidotransferase
MSVLVVDYGMGNLNSVRRAIENCGAAVNVSPDPRDLAGVSAVVLPGVGSFADGMGNLRRAGWEAPLREAVLRDGVPLLGICLGMQLLADRGEEGGDSKGLGLIAGDVIRLKAPAAERIPHVGWNQVHFAAAHPVFDGIPDGSDFYFVHSFHFIPKSAAHAAATTPYCGSFVSAVAAGPVVGTQFHPEKSSKTGSRLLRNFLEQARAVTRSC